MNIRIGFRRIILVFISLIFFIASTFILFPTNKDYKKIQYSFVDGVTNISVAEKYQIDKEGFTYLQSYFYKLKNFGRNEQGSCGYVALGMLLSFYDNYLNDNIIPERYDIISEIKEEDKNKMPNSPGVRFDDETFSCDDEYLEKMKIMAESEDNPSLHAKLIVLGAELGYYGRYKDELPCGTSIDDREEILKKYLALPEINLKEGSDYTIDTYSSRVPIGSGCSAPTIERFVKDYIDAGYPVLLGVSGNNISHACIAYDYDEKGFICHFGDIPALGIVKNDVLSRVRVGEGERCDSIDSAMVVQFNMSHSHTNNYCVKKTDSNGNEVKNYYCYDSCAIKTYQTKEHSYTDHYTNNDSNNHTAYCGCGESVTEEHTITYTKKTALLHTAVCKCGYSKSSKHIWTSAPIVGGHSYVKCGLCGYLKQDDDYHPIIATKLDLEKEQYTIPIVPETEGLSPVFDMRKHDGE